MSDYYVAKNHATLETTLASAVANSGTFDVSYPSGYTQADFSNGLAGNHYMIVNGNDRWTVADSKMSVSFGSSTITVTNSTGASLAAGSKVNLFFDIKDGNEVIHIPFIIPAMSAIANGDLVTDFQPGVDGTIEHLSWVQTTPVTTGSKTATINLEIGSTNLTGGVLTLTSAACTPMGKVIEATAITGANTITKASKISLEASAVTAFVEGAGYFLMRVRLS